jgi:hypothetical protein
MRGHRTPEFEKISGFQFRGLVGSGRSEMPMNSKVFTRSGVVEVAPMLRLRTAIRVGLKQFGPATSAELADYARYGRKPNSKLGLRWIANQSARSSTRRAIAALRRAGEVIAIGRCGREMLYTAARRDKNG